MPWLGLARLGLKPSARAWISFGSLSGTRPRPTLVRRMFGQANDRQRVPSILIFECIMTGEAARGGLPREAGQWSRGGRAEKIVQGIAGGRTQWLAT